MVPVATEQVGCTVVLAVGAAGVTGCAFTTTLVAAEVQLPLLVVTLCVPGATPVYVEEDWKAPPSNE